MDRPRLIRGLRIAWSVWWGILCVLLVVLWVRSYLKPTSLYEYVSPTHRHYLYALQGQLFLVTHQRAFSVAEIVLVLPQQEMENIAAHPSALGFGSLWNGDLTFASYWLLTVVTLCTATIPWIRFRFSLRTLLIATTLISVVLGLGVAYLRLL